MSKEKFDRSKPHVNIVQVELIFLLMIRLTKLLKKEKGVLRYPLHTLNTKLKIGIMLTSIVLVMLIMLKT